MVRRMLILVLAILLFAGCVGSNTSGGSTGWIESLYDRSYPERDYLCAVGAGSSRENAVNAAFSSLSQVFDARVESTILTFSSSSAMSEGGTVVFSGDETMIDQGSVSSESGRIIGAEVVNTYVDPAGTVWVRVAIDRRRTVELYERDMAALERAMAQARLEAARQTSSLGSYFTLLGAVDDAVVHQRMVEQVALLNGRENKSLLHPLQRELDALASTITLKLEVRTDLGESTRMQIAGAFAALFNDHGFTVGESGPRALIEYEAVPLSAGNSPYVHVRYTLTLQVTDGSRVVATYRVQDRETAMTETDAMQRALRSALNAASGSFKESFTR